MKAKENDFSFNLYIPIPYVESTKSSSNQRVENNTTPSQNYTKRYAMRKMESTLHIRW